MAARFVSGYLMMKSWSARGDWWRGATQRGCRFTAGRGWVEFDPTNALIGGAKFDSG